MKQFKRILGGLIAMAVMVSLAPVQAASFVTIEETKDGQYDVLFGGQLFATLHTKGFPKPILYPIIGPHGVRMTRDYPMKEGTPGEAKDHPHHQSFWFDHGDVNGISFWDLRKDAGKIVTTEVTEKVNQGASARIAYRDKWVDAKGNTVCTDRQRMTFHKYQAKGGIEFAMIDYEITVEASEGDVVFGDTKEGSMGIRTHPKLRIDKGARAVNSEGVTGKPIWGKRAKWVDYSAEIDGHTVGFAIMDHPSNPRHPTWWHAREYGLVAANPFGISDFEKKPKGTGDLKVSRGESITFRYRFIFHMGDEAAAGIGQEYERYAGK